MKIRHSFSQGWAGSVMSADQDVLRVGSLSEGSSQHLSLTIFLCLHKVFLLYMSVFKPLLKWTLHLLDHAVPHGSIF